MAITGCVITQWNAVFFLSFTKKITVPTISPTDRQTDINGSNCYCFSTTTTTTSTTTITNNNNNNNCCCYRHDKTFSSATLSTTNLTWTGLGSNPTFCTEKPGTNRPLEPWQPWTWNSNWIMLLNYYINHCTYIHLHIKTLKTLRHVSVLGPSSGSHIVLVKVTLLKVTLLSLYQLGVVAACRVVLCCVAKSALLWMCVLCFVAWYWQQVTWLSKDDIAPWWWS